MNPTATKLALTIFVFALSAYAQTITATPATCTSKLIVSGTGGTVAPFGPAGEGCEISVTGTGNTTYTMTNDCFGAVHTSNATPATPAALPATIYGNYTVTNPASTCTLTFTGNNGGSDTVVFSIEFGPRYVEALAADMRGTKISALGHCTSDANTYRWPNRCTVQEADTRPGGNWTPPARGTPYTDATFGGTVYASSSGFSREYMISAQINTTGRYHIAKQTSNGNSVIHDLTIHDGSGDYTGQTAICGGNGAASNMFFENDPAQPNVVYCQVTTNRALVKKFTLGTPPNVTDNGTVHNHGPDVGMNGGITGSGNMLTVEGDLVHFENDGAGNICVVNIRVAGDADTCIVPVYTPRNVSIAPRKSNTTGLYYIVVGSDSPNRVTFYSWDRIAKAITLVGRDVPVVDNPYDGSYANAKWRNGTCTTGVDCQVLGHHGVVWAAGEPLSCGHGRGRIQRPNYSGGGNCVELFRSTSVAGRTLREHGGAVSSALSAFEGYYVPALRSPVQITVQEGGSPNGQGLTPAYRIDNVACTAGACVATLESPGSTTGNGWTSTQPVFIDGVAGLAVNGRQTLTAITSTTLSFTVGSLTGTSTSNTGSVTNDTAYTTGMAVGGVSACRHDNGFCRIIANPLTVSYGAPSAGTTGTWYGTNNGAPGYDQLAFPTTDIYGKKACWATGYGYLETHFYACADTGFDLDESSQPWHFDKYGRGVYVSAVASDRATITVKPTNPAFTCSFTISERPDFATEVGTVTLAGPGDDRANTPTGLTTNTQYWVKARCGTASDKTWDYGVAPFRTK